MSALKWFSGGEERRNEALIIMDNLLTLLDHHHGVQPLKDLLLSYAQELKSGGISTPFILSRMHIELSKVLMDNKIRLSEEQSELLKELRSLSNIRYGY